MLGSHSGSYFQVSDQGETTNSFSWNKVANMLYLESPAGSGQSSGFSACIKGGKDVSCSWDGGVTRPIACVLRASRLEAAANASPAPPRADV
jgi:hypothetical protein